jgi:putative transposase
MPIYAHKIRLKPNMKQRNYFNSASGGSRVAYNWALAFLRDEYQAGRIWSFNDLKKAFRVIQDLKFPWMRDFTKCSPEQAMADLHQAFKNFWKGKGGYPKFKKKGSRKSFYLSNDQFKLEGKKIKIPKLGWVRMREELRFSGKIMSATVSETAGHWFVSIAVDLGDQPRLMSKTKTQVVGVDLGIKALATVSDGTQFRNLRPLMSLEKKLKQLQKHLSRKVKGSRRWLKCKSKIARLHYRIACIRKDYLHKITTHISRNYSHVVMEDLNVKGMMANGKLAKHIGDASFNMFKQMIGYKADNLIFVDRFFPSSRMCFDCGQVHDMPLSSRMMDCDCGNKIDRDLNASNNLCRQALSTTDVDSEALVISKDITKLYGVEAFNFTVNVC